MRSRLSNLVAIVTMAAVVAGCGARRGGGEVRSNEAFVARANDICAEAQSKIYAVPEPSNPESLEETSAYLTKLLAIQEERLKGLRKLRPPEEDAKAVNGLEAELAKSVESLRAAAKAAADGDRAALAASTQKIGAALAARSELARRAGLMECVGVLSGEAVLKKGPKGSTLEAAEPFNLGNYRGLFLQLRGRAVPEAEQAALSDSGLVAGFVRRWTKEDGGASFVIEVLEFKTPQGAKSARRSLERLSPPEGVQVRDREALEVPGIAGATGSSYVLEDASGASYVSEILFLRGSRLFRVSATSEDRRPSDEVRRLARRQEKLAVHGGS